MPSFKLLIAASAIASLAMMPACSDDEPQPTIADTTAPLSKEKESACASTAASLCERIEACSPRALLYLYGDRAACERDLVGACRVRYRGASAPLAPAACDGASLSCEVIKSSVVGSLTGWTGPVLLDLCPTTSGSVPDGAACNGDGDCASGSCSKAPCGVCLPKAAEGATCMRSTQCGSGQICSCEANVLCNPGTCRKPAALGETCDEARPCAGDDISTKCRGGICVARGGEGAPCGDDTPGCDLGAGLVCTNGTCRLVTVGDTGAACDYAWFTGGGDTCTGANACVSAGGPSPTCSKVGRLGEPCGRCATGLTCRTGRCRPQNESQCSR